MQDADSPLTYLALGDSYTIGEGVAATERWPAQLAAALRGDGIAVADPHFIATTGWTTDELSAAMDAAGPLGTWDFVSLLIGVNNQYRGRDAGEYEQQFDALLRRAVSLAGGRADRVLVLSIPDWGVTPFAKADAADPSKVERELDDYNERARMRCEATGVAFVDITPVSRTRGAEPSMLVADALHPSRAMYALWTAQALPVARRLLSEARA